MLNNRLLQATFALTIALSLQGMDSNSSTTNSIVIAEFTPDMYPKKPLIVKCPGHANLNVIYDPTCATVGELKHLLQSEINKNICQVVFAGALYPDNQLIDPLAQKTSSTASAMMPLKKQ